MERTERGAAWLLVVEDDPTLLGLLRRTLDDEGYAVDTVRTGEAGLDRALSREYDLILLDIVLPEQSGLEVLRELRARGRDTPVLMLTGQTGADAIVRGLEEGADDYLEKPFALPVLLARIRALMRRTDRRPAPVLERGDIRMDRDRHELRVDGVVLELPPREYDLLEALLRNDGVVVSRDLLLRSVWQLDFDPGTNRVDVAVSRLRKELRAAGSRVRIEAVRGQGYRLGDG